MITDGKHLTEEQIAAYAEALALGTESSLPSECRKHMAECAQCTQEVRMVSQIIDEETKAPDNNCQN
ncbi:MAG: hypothetical protein ACQESJ_08535 [Bacteroidota bacterium]